MRFISLGGRRPPGWRNATFLTSAKFLNGRSNITLEQSLKALLKDASKAMMLLTVWTGAGSCPQGCRQPA